MVDSFEGVLALLLPLSSWKSEKDSGSPSVSHCISWHMWGGGSQYLACLVLHFVSY